MDNLQKMQSQQKDMAVKNAHYWVEMDIFIKEKKRWGDVLSTYKTAGSKKKVTNTPPYTHITSGTNIMQT